MRGERRTENRNRNGDRNGKQKTLLRFPFLFLSLFLLSVFCFLISSPLFAWHPPQVEKVTLPNGFRIYLLPDHTLPLFRAKIFVEAGQTYEPSSKTGLADLVAGLLATGGTKEKEPLKLDQWLDQRAISLSADAGRELTTVTLSCLSSQKTEGLMLLKEVLLEPRFDPERLELSKRQYQEGLRREEDQPLTIVSKEFRKLVYGKDHPWGREATFKTIKKIQREDLLSFYGRYFHPNRMLLAVAGDFSPQEMKAWAREHFGGLATQEVEPPSWPEIPFENRFEEKKIKKKLTQAFIEVGHLALKRHDEEKYAYDLLQYILGGDVFTSRLGVDIRTTRGLAYSVYSTWETAPVRGFFRIHVETKKESLGTVLEHIQTHLKNLKQEANITPEELKRAKEAMVNQYIFWFESPFEVVSMQAKMDLLGYEKDYLQKYPQRMKAVTLEEVQKVAGKYIEPEGLKIVIVGP